MSNTTFPTWDELSEREQLLCIASDIGKDAMGIRPRWIADYTVEQLRESIAQWQSAIDAEAAAEKEARDRYSRIKSQALTRREWKIGNFFSNSLAFIAAR